MKLASNIAKARRRAGLSRAGLADLIGTRRADVYGWEAGNHEPRISMVMKIAKITKTPLIDLLS